MVITIPYPDELPYALRTTPLEFEAEAKMAMAMALFSTGRITSGQAAMLAGSERVNFLSKTASFSCTAAMPLPNEIQSDFKVLQ
jgi:hypothetical protein